MKSSDIRWATNVSVEMRRAARSFEELGMIFVQQRKRKEISILIKKVEGNIEIIRNTLSVLKSEKDL